PKNGWCMPSTPITSRTLYYQQLSDGTFRLADWMLSTTSLGVMVEPRTVQRPFNNIKDEDGFDSSISTISVLPAMPTGVYAFDQMAYAGTQWPHYRANDPNTLE
ncbi:MAG TPA: hypothetical protein VF443_11185, partial [Nitrospira sp.]